MSHREVKNDTGRCIYLLLLMPMRYQPYHIMLIDKFLYTTGPLPESLEENNQDFLMCATYLIMK